MQVFSRSEKCLFRTGALLCALQWLFWLFVGVVSAASPNLVTDGCDWTGSGLAMEGSRGVQPVYLRCQHGTVTWLYPRGALRILLRYGTSGKDFRGCLRVAPHWSGARIYLEGHRKLYPLWTEDIGGEGQSRDKFRCFVSRGGQVALYVEATGPVEAESISNSVNNGGDVTSFSYDLTLATKASLADEYSECRPCSSYELLQRFCTSDFVVRGHVMTLSHNETLDLSVLGVRPERVLSHQPTSLPPEDQSTGTLNLYRPLKCGTKLGSGEFLFMGRWMLGYPVVHCAPRISEWKKVRRRSLKEGTNQCAL